MTAAATYLELRPTLVRRRVAAGDGSFDWMTEGEELFDAVDLWRCPLSPLETAATPHLSRERSS